MAPVPIVASVSFVMLVTSSEPPAPTAETPSDPATAATRVSSLASTRTLLPAETLAAVPIEAMVLSLSTSTLAAPAVGPPAEMAAARPA